MEDTLDKYINIIDYDVIEVTKKINGQYSTNRFLPTSKSLMSFLSYFNTEFKVAWDIDQDGDVDTADLLLLLPNYGKYPEPNPTTELPINRFEWMFTGGEGNYWFSKINDKEEVLFDNQDISFLWYHTTPYDDNPFEARYPQSFDLDIVFKNNNIYTFTFIKKGYSPEL